MFFFNFFTLNNVYFFKSHTILQRCTGSSVIVLLETIHISIDVFLTILNHTEW
jgi:hypothetical protein